MLTNVRELASEREGWAGEIELQEEEGEKEEGEQGKRRGGEDKKKEVKKTVRNKEHKTSKGPRTPYFKLCSLTV